MAEDEALFDLSLKKKKGKAKKPIDFEALEAEQTETTDPSDAAAASASETAEGTNNLELDPELAEINELLTKTKKKKKKATFNMEELETALPEPSGTAAGPGLGEDKENNSLVGQDPDTATVGGINLDDDLDFDISKKKKKKKKINFEELASQEAADSAQGGGGEDGIEFSQSTEVSDATKVGLAAAALVSMPWLESDRDYTFDDLINRIYGIIREKNPDIVGDKKRLVMRPPQVLRVGTKKTSFANFLDICKSLHRQPKHMQSFLLAELGTSGSVDANNTLIIKGRFQQKQIENVLRRYIKEYVACQTCRSPETILQKDTRLFFLQCESCGSRRSVASIKSGFQALTSKRAAIRAKGT